MSKNSERYSQENALLFSRLEALSGKLEERIARIKVNQQEIIGLKFELEKVQIERDELKERLQMVRKELHESKSKTAVFDSLEDQNFTIRNKIAKIVSDSDSQQVSDEDVRELIDTMVAEIDKCIQLLKNK